MLIAGTTRLAPYVGVKDQSMSVYLERKVLLVYDIDSQSSLASTYTNSTNVKGKAKGTYRIYLRNWTGKTMSGSIDITY